MPEIADELVAVSLTVDGDVVLRYGTVAEDFNPIHFDDAAARTLGLPGAIAHGMIAGALVNRMLAANLGPDWLRAGRLELKFVRPTPVGATVTARGRVRGRQPLIIDVEVVAEDGSALIVGTAVPA